MAGVGARVNACAKLRQIPCQKPTDRRRKPIGFAWSV